MGAKNATAIITDFIDLDYLRLTKFTYPGRKINLFVINGEGNEYKKSGLV